MFLVTWLLEFVLPGTTVTRCLRHLISKTPEGLGAFRGADMVSWDVVFLNSWYISMYNTVLVFLCVRVSLEPITLLALGV